MDEQLTKLIKENKGILRQLTDLNDMVKGLTIIHKDMVIDDSYLEKRVRTLEQVQTYYPLTEKEIANIKIGGTD